MRLLIVDDHPIIACGIRSLLAEDREIEIREARSAAQAKRAIKNFPPDVMVLDINLSDGSGLNLCRDAVVRQYKMGVILFSMFDAPILALKAIQRGARGYVSKSEDVANLRKAIHAVASGEFWLSENFAQELAFLKIHIAPPMNLLSERELKIIKSLARGRSIDQIAKTIAVSYGTIAKDCERMRDKFNARDATELIRIATELKIV